MKIFLQEEIEKIEKEKYDFQSMINEEIPIYFINKLEDINVIFAQQYLESCDHCVNVNKSKNKEDKIENMQKLNEQKSYQWLEKNKIII